MSRIIAIIISVAILFGINVYAVGEGAATTTQYLKGESQPQTIIATARELSGEIMAITDSAITLRSPQGILQLKLADGARLYCNGLLSNWRALRPVSNDAYFEARLLLNSLHQAVMVKGEYHGVEAVISELRRQPRMQLVLFLPDTQAIIVCSLAANAKLPKGDRWQSEGQAVYVLYNFQGEIRAVFLPD